MAQQGPDDSGLSVLLSRMHNAKSTNEKIMAFCRERIAIEDDYAKRLASLSNIDLGLHELGHLKHSLDVLQSETSATAAAHATTAAQLGKDFADKYTTFANTSTDQRRKVRYFSDAQVQGQR